MVPKRKDLGPGAAHSGEKCDGARPCGWFSFGPRSLRSFFGSSSRSLLAESVLQGSLPVPARNPLPCSWDSPIGLGRPRLDTWAVTDG